MSSINSDHQNREECQEETISLTSWLYKRYGMSYKAYRRKSPAQREILRQEYEEDTEAIYASRRRYREKEFEYWSD